MTFCHISGKCEYKMQEMGKSYSYIHIFFISLSYYFPVYFVDLSLSFPCYHYHHYILIMITWWKSVSICFVISVLVLIFFLSLLITIYICHRLPSTIIFIIIVFSFFMTLFHLGRMIFLGGRSRNWRGWAYFVICISSILSILPITICVIFFFLVFFTVGFKAFSPVSRFHRLFSRLLFPFSIRVRIVSFAFYDLIVSFLSLSL